MYVCMEALGTQFMPNSLSGLQIDTIEQAIGQVASFLNLVKYSLHQELPRRIVQM